MYLPYKCFVNPDKQSLLLQKTESMPVRCAFLLRISFCRLVAAMDLSALLAEKPMAFFVCEEGWQTTLSGSAASGVSTVQVHKGLMKKKQRKETENG